jgi:hypothetical protein
MSGPKNTVHCPDYCQPFNCGPGKIWNLVKSHLGTEACKNQKRKTDKAKATSQITELTSFFGRAKVTPATPFVSMKASEPMQVKTLKTSHIPTSQSFPKSTITPQSPPSLSPSAPPFMVEFIALAAQLPSIVPEGKDHDVFAIFVSEDPSAVVPEGMSDEDAWEQVLDPMLNRVFQGVTDDELGMLVRRGRRGVDGFASFMMFWIERGVGIFEPRVDRLSRVIQR